MRTKRTTPAARTWRRRSNIAGRRMGCAFTYAISGSGPPLVRSGNWLNHLEYDRETPIWRHVLRGLSREHTLIRYDARGNGMSDWDVVTLSLEAWVTDLETVVDAVGVERFPLFGISQGCAVAVAYAVRHPEWVSHLILYGGFALGGNKRTSGEKEMRAATMTLMRFGWGADNPSFRANVHREIYSRGDVRTGGLFQRAATENDLPECATRYYDVTGDIDILELLPKVKAPILVMHARDYAVVPFEAGCQLAAGIRGARFIALAGRNHLFMEHERFRPLLRGDQPFPEGLTGRGSCRRR